MICRVVVRIDGIIVVVEDDFVLGIKFPEERVLIGRLSTDIRRKSLKKIKEIKKLLYILVFCCLKGNRVQYFNLP